MPMPVLVLRRPTAGVGSCEETETATGLLELELELSLRPLPLVLELTLESLDGLMPLWLLSSKTL